MSISIHTATRSQCNLPHATQREGSRRCLHRLVREQAAVGFTRSDKGPARVDRHRKTSKPRGTSPRDGGRTGFGGSGGGDEVDIQRDYTGLLDVGRPEFLKIPSNCAFACPIAFRLDPDEECGPVRRNKDDGERTGFSKDDRIQAAFHVIITDATDEERFIIESAFSLLHHNRDLAHWALCLRVPRGDKAGGCLDSFVRGESVVDIKLRDRSKWGHNVCDRPTGNHTSNMWADVLDRQVNVCRSGPYWANVICAFRCSTKATVRGGLRPKSEEQALYCLYLTVAVTLLHEFAHLCWRRALSHASDFCDPVMQLGPVWMWAMAQRYPFSPSLALPTGAFACTLVGTPAGFCSTTRVSVPPGAPVPCDESVVCP